MSTQFKPLGEFSKFNMGESISVGDVVCLDSADQVVKADSTVSSKMPAIGFVKSVRGSYCIVQLSYLINLGSLNAGDIYYVSTNGTITNSIQNAQGTILQRVGTATNSNNLLINIETQTITL